jgi:hypothetical protein
VFVSRVEDWLGANPAKGGRQREDCNRVNILAEHQTGLIHHVEIEGEDGYIWIWYNFSIYNTHLTRLHLVLPSVQCSLREAMEATGV